LSEIVHFSINANWALIMLCRTRVETCGLAGSKARQLPVAVAKCGLNHGGPMHMQLAACQFITLPLWYGAVKPILGRTGACGSTLAEYRVTEAGSDT